MKTQNKNGITLIALVITVIVLLILAGVAISLAIDGGGLFARANNAAASWNRAVGEEENAINGVWNILDSMTGGNGEGTGTTPTTPTEPTNPSNPTEPEEPQTSVGPTGKPLVNKETVSDFVTGTALVGEDRYGNQITIPVGFKVAEDSGADVTEGIVIEDNDLFTYNEGTENEYSRGNQYVWVPVGTIYTDSAMTAANAKEITAGRYQFSQGSQFSYVNESGTTLTDLPNGTPILKQSLSNYETQPTNITYSKYGAVPSHGITDATNKQIVVYDYYYELKSYISGAASQWTNIRNNRSAFNLSGFSSSVDSNKGFYIARYEASWGNGNSVKSRVSVGTPQLSSPSARTNGQLWNFVSQVDAAGYCQNLYDSLNSDLMNSYAWDTALLYIQTFSESNNYSNHRSKFNYYKYWYK